MIVTGCPHTGKDLGAYLLQDKSDRVEQWGIRGDIPRDLIVTLNDWCSDSLGTNCSLPLYHLQLSPDQALSPEEWEVLLKVVEIELGFENQPRVLVMHEKDGRQHLHVVYSRMDENGHAISASWNYLHHEKAAREIEKILGMEKTQGVFIDRTGKRPERTPSHAAIQQAERLNLDLKQIKTEVRQLYQCSDNSNAFVAALESEGYTFARGDLGSHVLIDRFGGVHSLLRLVDVKADVLRATLSDYSLQNLPSVQAAQSLQQARQQAVLEVKQEAKSAFSLGIQPKKQAAKSLSLAERIQQTQQERLNQREMRQRGETIKLEFETGRGLSLNLKH